MEKNINRTKYEINKIMYIQSKDSCVCQKSRDSTANNQIWGISETRDPKLSHKCAIADCPCKGKSI